MTIGIVDIGLGNIASVVNAVYSQGWDSILIKKKKTLVLLVI